MKNPGCTDDLKRLGFGEVVGSRSFVIFCEVGR